MRDGSGIYFDGKTSARRTVSLELADTLIRIRDVDGMILDEWPYAALRQLASPVRVLRLGLRGEPVPARLEVRNPDLAAAIDARALSVDRTGAVDRRARMRVVAWSLLATLSLVAVAVLIVPNIAARLTPFIPVALEQRLGRAVDVQVRKMLDDEKLGPRLSCGDGAGEYAGRAALDALTRRLAAAAALPMPVTVSVLRRHEANAFALPGGHIYLFEGLLNEVQNPDELAGVIAHEMGHVAHRDGTRTMLQSAGLSLLFGMVLGDFVGGSAVVIAARTLVHSSYSRAIESAADAYGVRLVARIGGDPKALAAVLTRIGDNPHPGMQIWLDHPQVADRVRAIERIAGPPSGATLLTSGQWTALKQICRGAP